MPFNLLWLWDSKIFLKLSHSCCVVLISGSYFQSLVFTILFPRPVAEYSGIPAKHSGFVINKGNATAKDITDLIKHIQDEVKKQFGVELHTEVRIVGEDENN